MALKTAVVQSLLTATALLVSAPAFADDAPVEKPAVDRPALPEPNTATPPESTHSPSPATRQSSSAEGDRQTQRSSVFPYFALGPGVLIGLSGGADFERTNPALTGGLGVEIPVAPRTGLGIELTGDLELAAAADRGTYTSLLLRARLGRMLTPRNRVWGAVGLGGAGYQSTSLAFGLAGGTSLMLVPKFGLDFSANLGILGASNWRDNGVQHDYPGGAVLLFAVRALFEVHR